MSNEELREQLCMIGTSAADFAAARGGPQRARRVHEGALALDPKTWRAIAGLGWFGIAVPEADGGLALGAAAACVVAEEAGRALLSEPLATGMAAASVLAAARSLRPADEALQALLAGEGHVAMACAATADRGEEIFHIGLVPEGDAASLWLAVRGDGADFEARLLRVGSPGVGLSVRAAVDGSRLADARVERAAWFDAPRILQGAEGASIWSRGLRLAWLADAAALCGLADAALKLALEYMRLRHQFGVPIGSFQALQHRAADCHVDATASRALVHEAARAADSPRGNWAAAAAIVRASATALRVTQEVVQFHGAIGFADEHDAGLYLRRAMALGARHTRSARARLQESARL
jgi:alkylation response protein AidB-like acyl-CoA dehydrogenase